MNQAKPIARTVGTRCPGCAGQASTLLWRSVNDELESPMTFDVVRCDSCGLAYTSPMPSLADLMPFYNTGIYAKDERRAPAAVDRILWLLADVRLREIEAIKRPGRLLDVGSGKGRFLSRAGHRGWRAKGVEPVAGSVALARARHGVDVIVGTLEEAAFAARSFDVVTMWHVLEHLADPRGAMAEARRLLDDGGLLALEIPNLASLQAQIGRDRWFHMMLPHHLVHFTPETLRRLLADNGFEVVRMRTFSPEHGPFGMLQSLLNRAGGERDFLFHRLKRVPHRSRPAAFAAMMAWTVVGGTIAAVPAALVEVGASWAGRGGTIRVIARKD